MPTRLAALALALFAVAATAQTPLLKTSDLEADATILREAYEQLHPGLYRYNTKSQMDANFAELNHALDHDQSLDSAYLAFSLFAAKVKCGHTYANFFNQTKAITHDLLQRPNRVPFYFVWLPDAQGRYIMVVTEDFTPDHTLPRGTRILAINGHATSDVLTQLMRIARADGSNDAKRRALLGVSGDDRYETFDIYYPLFFPFEGSTFTLLAQTPTAKKPATVHATALTYDQRIAPMQAKQKVGTAADAPLFTFRFLANRAAYLKMPTWAMYESKWDWRPWLNARLDEAADQNAPALILDLRDNEGGEDVGNVILSRLIDHDLPITSLNRLVRYRKIPSDLAPYLDTWDPSFKDWGAAAVALEHPWPTAPAGIEYLRLTKYDDDASGDVIHPAGKRFHGRVFVLVGATNSSATFQFAQVIQQNHLGTLVGAPTGGSQRGINGGGFFFLRLPHSQIELDLPLIASFPRDPKPDAGLTPDILILPTAKDIASGNDPVLTATESRIP